MPPQIACLRRCIVTLVTFVWFFSTVRFQMRPQMACLRGCIVTLVAFVWLFSTVCFQMRPQIAGLRTGKVALVTFVWLFSTVRYLAGGGNWAKKGEKSQSHLLHLHLPDFFLVESMWSFRQNTLYLSQVSGFGGHGP